MALRPTMATAIPALIQAPSTLRLGRRGAGRPAQSASGSGAQAMSIRRRVVVLPSNADVLP